MKKTLAFAGSNSSTSINKQLVNYAASLIEGVDVIDLRDYDAPIYSQDLEKSEGINQNIQKLYDLIKGYESVIIASPEHNGLPPAFLKNTLDWLSRCKGDGFLKDKKVALLSTSPGGFGGKNNLANLKNIMPYWGANIVGTYSLGKFFENMDSETNTLKSEDEKEALLALLKQL
jgi:chromate reductase